MSLYRFALLSHFKTNACISAKLACCRKACVQRVESVCENGDVTVSTLSHDCHRMRLFSTQLPVILHCLLIWSRQTHPHLKQQAELLWRDMHVSSAEFQIFFSYEHKILACQYFESLVLTGYLKKYKCKPILGDFTSSNYTLSVSSQAGFQHDKAQVFLSLHAPCYLFKLSLTEPYGYRSGHQEAAGELPSQAWLQEGVFLNPSEAASCWNFPNQRSCWKEHLKEAAEGVCASWMPLSGHIQLGVAPRPDPG